MIKDSKETAAKKRATEDAYRKSLWAGVLVALIALPVLVWVFNGFQFDAVVGILTFVPIFLVSKLRARVFINGKYNPITDSGAGNLIAKLGLFLLLALVVWGIYEAINS